MFLPKKTLEKKNRVDDCDHVVYARETSVLYRWTRYSAALLEAVQRYGHGDVRLQTVRRVFSGRQGQREMVDKDVELHLRQQVQVVFHAKGCTVRRAQQRSVRPPDFAGEVGAHGTDHLAALPAAHAGGQTHRNMAADVAWGLEYQPGIPSWLPS